MTITVAPARNELTANAGQTIFNYTFKIFSITDLNVYITPAGQEANDSTDLTTAYTVLGVGDEDGGTITLTVGANLNDLVTIVSNTPSSRTTDYQNNGDFRPDTVNADFDRVVALVKKIEDLTNRALLSAQSKQGPKPLILPQPVSTKLLRWRNDLAGLENIDVSQLSPGLIADDQAVFTFTNFDDAIASVDAVIMKVGRILIIQNRKPGDEAFAFWKIITAGATPFVDLPNTWDIVATTGVAGLALELLFINELVQIGPYGLFGDGVTGESSAINAAIARVKNSPLSITRGLVQPTGAYFIDAPLDLFSGLNFHHNPSVVYNCGAAFFNKQDGVDALSNLTISGNPTIRTDGVYTGDLFRTDSMTNVKITALFDGKDITTGRLLAVDNLFAGTDAYNNIDCEFRRCLNSTDGALFIEGGTFTTITGSKFGSNAKNFSVNGKNHIFGDRTSIEKSLVNGSEVFSPLTNFEQCWIEQDELTIKDTAYGSSIIDCRSRGGTLDNTDFHLLNFIKDETIEANFFKKHSPGLNYREGNRVLKVLWPTNDTGTSLLSINSGGPVSYGINSPLSIVGYVVHLNAGGSITDLTMNVGVNGNYNPSSPSFTPLTSFELDGAKTTTDDKYVITWSNTPSIYFDLNPSSFPTFELMLQFATDQASNYQIVVGVLVVATV